MKKTIYVLCVAVLLIASIAAAGFFSSLSDKLLPKDKPSLERITGKVLTVPYLEEAGYRATSARGPGVFGESTSGFGVYGKSTEGMGVVGESLGTGNGVRGNSNGGNGVYGASDRGTGVYASSTAGKGLITNAVSTTQYSAMFSGGKGIYIENGIYVKKGTATAQGITQDITIGTKILTVTNGIITGYR